MAYYQEDALSPSRTEQDAARLVVDCMLGSLARRLRLIGYDVHYQNDAGDHALARLARVERRALLTRDQELAGRRGLRTLLIRSDVLEEQVLQVLASIPIAPSDRIPRCSVCNGRLDHVERSEVVDRVPPYVLRSHDAFVRCACCARVYWPGSHHAAIRASIDSLDMRDDGDG